MCDIDLLKIKDLKPGDVLVVKSDRNLTGRQFDRIKETLLETLPKGVNSLVLDKGFDIDIIRPWEDDKDVRT